MPGNTEERKKCLEKLNQMQKYLPFIDFMIDKIKKTNSEILLECQLSKFQLLRSMIAEKNVKYSWKVIVKVEDVIQKLISKLDFKDPHEKSKQQLPNADSQICNIIMSTSVSVVPSSTTVASVATTASSRTTTVDSNSQNTSTDADILITKTLKISVDSGANKHANRHKELLSIIVEPVNVPGKTLEMDLDKDLDGFDLTDCHNLSGTGEAGNPTPEKASSHDDLLSSSREKLLKSLQSRFFPGRIPTSSASSLGYKNEKESESHSSAFSRSQISFGERKTKNDVAENSEQSAVRRNNNKDVPVKVSEKIGMVSKPLKSGNSFDKNRTELPSNSTIVSLKQKLKEKLSTDICEVYRVPGKSVGGSLRSLKESKERKKNFSPEEGDLFKPDKPFKKELSNRSRLSSEKKDDVEEQPHRDSTQNTNEMKRNKSAEQSQNSSHKHRSGGIGSRKHDDMNLKSVQKDVKNTGDKNLPIVKPLKKSTEQHFELSKLNDDELLEFVNENVQSFPYLAKMKLPELKQAVQSSLVCKLMGLDTDAISEISEDSFHDLDDIAVEDKNSKHSKSESISKNERKETETAEIGSDGVSSAQSSKDTESKVEDDLSYYENLDDEEYALRLIEDTTPKTYSPKKKKGLLELPMPITDDLFHDISSIESFESCQNPTESKDPRLKKNKSNANKLYSPTRGYTLNTSELSSGANSTRSDSQPKDTNHSLKFLTDKQQRCGQEKGNNKQEDEIPAEFSNFYSKSPSFNTDAKCHSQPASEAKSYAEYKRRKLKEQEKVRKEIRKSASSESSNGPDVPQPPVDKEETGRSAVKNVQDPRIRNSFPKHASSKSHSPVYGYENRKSDPFSKFKPREDFKERKNSEEEAKKEESDKAKRSPDTEESVSPLEQLYRNESKRKTGRGYGIQNFKIPKNEIQKSSQFRKNLSSNKKGIRTSDVNLARKRKKPFSTNAKESETVKVEVVESAEAENSIAVSENRDGIQIDSIVSCKSDEKVESSVTCPKTDLIANEKKAENSPKTVSSENSTNTKGILETNFTPKSVDILARDNVNGVSEVKSKTGSIIEKTDAQQTPKPVSDAQGMGVVTINETNRVVEIARKFETQVVECDSSMETSTLNERNSGDKSEPVSKEEITQEFVEALIRKSFQSGEGKLLLAQVKLFEKFAKKLNSKKLKTIQKIINSESDSSSSSSETSSEDEKKKRKGKKLEEKSQKNKRRKKKGKSKKKKRTSSSSTSSSSESEETSEEENCDRKGVKNDNNKNVSLVSSAVDDNDESEALGMTITHASEELKTKNSEPSAVPKTKYKKRRRNLNFGRNFTGSRAKQQKKKKLLEQVLSESPQPEASNDSNTENACEAPAKNFGPRTKCKVNARGRTELDRLHDDIRSMFISEGIVTATGQRMCRILKQSGGNMNNLDIVKESAKMVEEEKLKKVQTRTSLRNPRLFNTDSRSRSQSEDRGKTHEGDQENEEKDFKLAMEPRITLQRVDLNNFGYGIKISEDCISFRRMKGRNTALKRTKISGSGRTSKNHSNSSVARNVFLARNKRKYERLGSSNRKKSYRGKKLMEVVKNLPLKMAKMKHLQICEKKTTAGKKKSGDGKLTKKTECKTEFTDLELLRYAFNKKRIIYPCKLCTCVTKNITAHYKAFHPNDEVLISRLTVGEAKKAKLEAEEYARTKAEDEKRSLAASVEREMSGFSRRRISYYCRMCPSKRISDIETFATHVSSHTGEYRYKCPSQNCTVQKFSHDDMRFHILTKHSKYRNELSNKITELYAVTVDEGILCGFLCSKCHFVQICRINVENHVSSQHGDSEHVTVIKINMSGRKAAPAKKIRKNMKDDANTSETKRKSEKSDEKPPGPDINDNDEKEINKRKRKLKDKLEFTNEEGGVEFPPKKKLLLSGKAGSVEAEETATRESGELLHRDKIEAEKKKNAFEGEDCVDLKHISELKGSDIVKGIEEMSPFKGRNSQIEKDGEVVESVKKLRVGPLEAQLLQNSAILYECYVKGCLFSTRIFDLFQKHIKISHWKAKWSGICDICTGRESQPRGENTFRLLTALKHLKLHELESLNKEKSTEDLLVELKFLDSLSNLSVNDEDSEKLRAESQNRTEVKEKSETQAKLDSEAETSSYPPKPLLRVRNFLGDRLSTPKADENQVGISEEDSNATEPSTNSTIFTIEDVRSLTDTSSEESGLKIEQVCSLKDQVSKKEQENQLGSGKTIIVRSCPSRKIAIRPEPSAVPVDVGHINVIQPPVSAHPVVLSPISSSPSIRILSTALTTKSFAFKPIIVPTDPAHFSGPTVMPVIHPVISSTVTNPTLLPAVEIKNASQKPVEGDSGGIQSNGSLDVEKVTSPTRSKSPLNPAPGTFHLGKSSPDQEETDKKDGMTTQRIHSSPSVGKKSVKDAKIYQEMLTKTKLCHLFKCMGIECSFTCNDENVFTQHIGLHEAQRRLEKSKGIKTFRLANKTTEAFHWQQCAYCCEVLSNTNNALSRHILEEHGHCMYQCAYCFYRALSHNYVEIHQNLAHSQILKTTPRIVYKCKPLKIAPSQAIALEKHGRRQSVRPYHCDQCGQKFFITHEFTRHLATEHQSVTAYTCHICKNLCFKVNRLINHYKLHSYSTYQCAYCLHGNETEKEMMFHLSNFHFSQPAVMYMRALAEGQKHLSNQLDSLKVIAYESEALSSDCVVEIEQEEENTENVSPSSVDLSSIVAELGINTDPDSSSPATGVTPLIQELASIGDKTAKNLTVKTLLPNAQFSSENESGIENCSVLISSGLSIPSDENDEREMSIPLGQLPLDVVNIQHREATPPTPTSRSVSPPDRDLKLNEIIVNLQQKDKGRTLAPGAEDEKAGQRGATLSSAVHKLPPVVLTRVSLAKSSYPSKCAVVRKKSEELVHPESTEGDKEPGVNQKPECNAKEKTPAEDKTQEGEDGVQNGDSPSRKCSTEKAAESGEEPKTAEPLITDVVCLLTSTPKERKESSQEVVTSLKPKTICSFLKPPIIRVEDFPIDDNTTLTPNKTQPNENPPTLEEPPKEHDEEKNENSRSPSPDVIILEEQRTRGIVTVTLDSDEEKDESLKKRSRRKESEVEEEVAGKSIGKNDTIRKEMELLRNQITNETDSLLNDEPTRNLSLDVEREEEEEPPREKTILSPIEEAICSLNRKLQSETEEAQKKEEEEKKERNEESPETPDACETKKSDRPRTRFGAMKKENVVKLKKKEGVESNSGKDDSGKGKKFKQELKGKELFICGNEKCTFAADNDISLKDHLYVCDLSRESSVFVCPHCSRQIKQLHPYLEHLRYHGEKKHHCGLCSFSSPVVTSTLRHVKQKHKCSLVKILPKESMEGHLAYYPKNYKTDKVDFEVNGYSPGDEDKLPLQSVYQVNVKCAKCPYFTKVRSNMVRHLKIHVKSVETEGVVVVPSTAPTNPVPCLETKERMFDKMTNLAASSQLAQAKEKTTVESLSPEEEAKLPQFIAEQLRYKCCLPDCNYITVDEGMLKHHIKALHDEINHYSCPHCKDTVHADVRHVTLDKIGYHLKHHDSKLYKCAHCIYFHYQKNVVEKHTVEKHPDRRYFVHTIREPKSEIPPEEESSSINDGGARVWKCALCDEFKTPSKPNLMDHLLKTHNTKSKYKCQFCSVKGNSYQAFVSHFSSKHTGEKVSYARVYHSQRVASVEAQSGNSSGADSSNEHFDTTPLWQRGAPRIRHIRGILIEEEEIRTKKSKRTSVDESEGETSDPNKVNENIFCCPLCTTKKKPFYTRNEDCFRTHLYQELNYQQFACILCGKMFVDRKDFEKHHSRIHSDKPQALKQTKEDHEIKFWVDQVIAKRRKQMEERKRKLSDAEASDSQGPIKKKKEV